MSADRTEPTRGRDGIERWPLGVGFDRYYGFIGWGTNQWAPGLTRDNSHLDPSELLADDRHVSEILASEAIRYLHEQQLKNAERDDGVLERPLGHSRVTELSRAEHDVAQALKCRTGS